MGLELGYTRANSCAKFSGKQWEQCPHSQLSTACERPGLDVNSMTMGRFPQRIFVRSVRRREMSRVGGVVTSRNNVTTRDIVYLRGLRLKNVDSSAGKERKSRQRMLTLFHKLECMFKFPDTKFLGK